MARGGIYDHLGGGFARYSTERTWTVPHFEKMLYDNAQLLELYAHGYRETKSPLYRHVLSQTIGFVRREMTAPEGGFYSALDADSEHEEGKFYVWTAQELETILGDADAKLVKVVYDAAVPNFEGKYSIFVRVTGGMAAAQALTPRDPQTNPQAPPGDQITAITIDEK